MYNAQKPSAEDLPSEAQLFRSTIIAALSAAVILITIVLPAEYGIDPTRIGGVLGLTEMGEIKTDLREEAERDQQSSLLDDVLNLFVAPAIAQEAVEWKDEISFTLKPGEGIEWKLVMSDGGVAPFFWLTDGGRVNFDLHGDGSGQSITYEKGRGQTSDEGEIVAAFAGQHGWFWRNRDKKDVTITLQLRGEYSDLKRTY